ncbi:MAG: Fis family transcriptional regulator [Planctomycetes bacterium]|jgi:DNA-binding NtrC family response regulator|nr:Fis family transcriptional regulator [Planctomycetota bacterium]MDP7246823.1 sigma-54 dependent transcriptional regulator [Planctomycetota bacterium]|tara:strand:+ start:6488 stop:7825 length:1338 start_codon:yes stop_codon:yes gene_type:complete
MRILLVEDEKTLAIPLAELLEEIGHEVTALSDGASALAWLEEDRCDLVLTDVRLPGADGIRVLERARHLDPPSDVIVMTGYASIEQAISAMKEGAFGYLQKPFPTEALLALVGRVAEFRQMQNELSALQGRRTLTPFQMTGTCQAMNDLRIRAEAAMNEESTLLMIGESGTGKGRLARWMHASGNRKGLPFVVLPCGALSETLLAGELFGYCKGAFSGADADHAGLLEQAGDGILFLDDVDDLSASAQAGLLRALQEKEFLPLGSTGPKQFRARVFSSTKSDLIDLVRQGVFREDLYYRLAVLPLHLPPLRERKEDLPLLVAEFLSESNSGGELSVPLKTYEKLAEHDWPGNVRELENSVQRAVALAGRASQLKPEHFFPGGPLRSKVVSLDEVSPIQEAVRLAEREAIRKALSATGGKKTAAAELLGLSRKSLWQKLKELGLES